MRTEQPLIRQDNQVRVEVAIPFLDDHIVQAPDTPPALAELRERGTCTCSSCLDVRSSSTMSKTEGCSIFDSSATRKIGINFSIENSNTHNIFESEEFKI